MVIIGLLGLSVLLAGVGLALTWTRIGDKALGEPPARVKASSNFRDGKFRNPVPTDNSWGLGKIWQTVKLYRNAGSNVPDSPPPIVRLTRDRLAVSPVSGLRATWLGHSSVLVEMEGLVILLDPVFSDRASPLSFLGPRRFHPVPVSIDDLPAIDAVVISHDHYDHLDYDTVLALAPKTKTFYLPLGVGAHLEYWGIDRGKIVEMDWWEETALGEKTRIVACPARHFSGRLGFGDRTQWSSFALIGRNHRVFFSGDTGFMPLFQQIGERFGPFDLTLVKIGAYGLTWPDIHLDPEQAVEVHRLVGGRLMIPLHWGTFNLSYHPWNEPAERVTAAASKAGATVVVPRPGQLVDMDQLPAPDPWWRSVERPIRP